jgi:glutaredoxin 3
MGHRGAMRRLHGARSECHPSVRQQVAILNGTSSVACARYDFAAPLRLSRPHPTLPLNKEIMMPDVEIYTQPGCPYCSRAMRIFSDKGVAFREIHAPYGTSERHEAIRRSGGRTTVPQIFIDGKHVGGCDDLVALDRSGKLDPMLQAA